MKLAVKTLDNKAGGDITVNDAIYGVEPRADILQRVTRWQQAKKQAGTHKTKTEGEIAGTTKKPFAQKGTGNARQGSKKTPHMRGGATIFGPLVRSHAHALPKKVRALGLKMALSSKLQAKKLIVLDSLSVKSCKTKDLTVQLAALDAGSKLIIGGETVDANFSKAASNVKHVDVLPIQGINVYDILRRDTLILSKEAVEALDKRFADDKPAKAAKKAPAKAAPAAKTETKEAATPKAETKPAAKKAAPKKAPAKKTATKKDDK